MMNVAVEHERIMTPKKLRKEASYDRTIKYFSGYRKFVVVDLTNISAIQLHATRQQLRGKGEFLMGKNTTIKLALRRYAEEHEELRGIEHVIRNNVGVIFTNGPLSEICDILETGKVSSIAKPGTLSQCDLWIEPVATSLEPGKTSFFQALGIATKITKGKIEILSRCQALHKGKRVGPSEAALLGLLGITPFVYKMEVIHAYADGKFFDVSYLSITESEVEQMVRDAVATLAAMGMGMGYVTESTVGQELANAVRDSCALALSIGYEMKELEALKSSAAQIASAQPAAAAQPPSEAAKEESEEEASDDFDLF